MSRLLGAFAALLLILIIGCGGGGGGGSSTSTDGSTNGVAQAEFSGTIIDVRTGIAISPAAQVTIGGKSTSTEDGSFSLTAPRSSNSIGVQTAAYGAWSFPLPTVSSATYDAGDLYIGPQRVTVRGTARDSVSDEPVSGAQVSFGGRTAVSGANGTFAITGVAYAKDNTSGFFGIVGDISATGYITQPFDAANIEASGGVVQVGDVRLVPTSDTAPPDGPYDITGTVDRSGATGALVVELLEGGNVIRTAPTRTDDRFYFWVEPGTYQIRATVGTRVATANVTLTMTDQIVTKNLKLP